MSVDNFFMSYNVRQSDNNLPVPLKYNLKNQDDLNH